MSDLTDVVEGTRCLRLKSLLDSEKVFAVLNYYEVAKTRGFSLEMEKLFNMTYIIYLVKTSLPLIKIMTNEINL